MAGTFDFSMLGFGGSKKGKKPKKEPTTIPEKKEGDDKPPMGLDALLAGLYSAKTSSGFKLPEDSKLSSTILTKENLAGLVQARTPKLPPEMLEAFKQNPEEALPQILATVANSIYQSALTDAVTLQEAQADKLFGALAPQIEGFIKENGIRTSLSQSKNPAQGQLSQMLYAMIKEQNKELSSDDALKQAQSVADSFIEKLRTGDAASDEEQETRNAGGKDGPNILDFWGVEPSDEGGDDDSSGDD